MPELPEVQTVVDDLKKKIVGRRILKIWSDTPKIVQRPNFKQFEEEIKNSKIENIRRRAKNILIDLNNNRLLLIHQKLTGHLLVGRWQIKNNQVQQRDKGILGEKVNDYIHLIFYLDNGQMLALSDLRKFAKVIFGSAQEIESLPDLKNLGPEPLTKDFTLAKFSSLFQEEKRKIKQVLMDQNVISGIGNIYSNEILWAAKICPFKSAFQLNPQERKNLYLALGKVLNQALRFRGTSVDNYRDTAGQPGKYEQKLKVYRRENQPCFRCQTLIKRAKMEGRSVYYCPKCQNK